MGILKNAADTVYAFRFIRMMVMDWKSWDAYKEGIIDENGKRDRNVKIDTDDKRSAYTPFVRLVANIKRLVSKLPGGGSKLGSFASALYLVKEKANLSEKGLKDICEKCDIEILDFLLWKWKGKLSREWYPYLFGLKQDLQINQKLLTSERTVKSQTIPLSEFLNKGELK